MYQKGSEFVSCGCHKQLTCNQWLTKTEVNSPPVLEDRNLSQKSKITVLGQGPFPLEALGGNLFFTSSRFLVWLYHSSLCLHLHVDSPTVCLSPLSVPSKDICHWIWGRLGQPKMIPYQDFNLITLQRAFFQINSHSQIPGIRTWNLGDGHYGQC